MQEDGLRSGDALGWVSWVYHTYPAFYITRRSHGYHILFCNISDMHDGNDQHWVVIYDFRCMKVQDKIVQDKITIVGHSCNDITIFNLKVMWYENHACRY